MNKKLLFLISLIILSAFWLRSPPTAKGATVYGTITIANNGSIIPLGAPISTSDNVHYTLTADINSNGSSGILIQKGGIILDGANHLLNATDYSSSSVGININGMQNVQVQNFRIEGFDNAVPITGDGCTVSGNTLQGNSAGVTVGAQLTATIINNQISSKNGIGEHGIRLINTAGATVSGNTITGESLYGISLEPDNTGIHGSRGNTLRNNAMSDNLYNFYIDEPGYSGIVPPGPIYYYFENDIDSSNTVNGKPVVYWVNQHDQTVPTNAGFVALIGCSGITAQNLDLEANYYGILLVATTGSTVKNNLIKGNNEGIGLKWASQNTITGNTLSHRIGTNDYFLIDDYESDHNLIEKNILILLEEPYPSTRSHYGIRTIRSNFETITYNNIKAYGLDYYTHNRFIFQQSNNITMTYNIFDNVKFLFSDAKNFSIYYNNFPAIHFQFTGTNTGTMFDHGYPAGGNFWGSLTGPDIYNGPAQNIPGSDGIIDAQRVLDTATDRYPLLTPTVPITSTLLVQGQNSLLTSRTSYITVYQLNVAAKSISFNVTGLHGTTGSCNITFPSTVLGGTLSVKLDGVSLVQNTGYTQTFNGTHYTLQIFYTHSTHKVAIIGTTVKPEFPTTTSMFLLLGILSAALLYSKRRQLPNLL